MILLTREFLLVTLKCPKLHGTDSSWVAKALHVHDQTVHVLLENVMCLLCARYKPPHQ